MAVVLSIGKIGVSHAGYYTGRASGREGYYTDSGEKPGRWASRGAMNVTAGSLVTSAALRAALACVDPGTGEQLGRKYNPAGRYTDALGVRRRRKAMSAYDMTYSVPKSVSVAWAVSDDDTRKQIEAAFDASTEAVIFYLQRYAVASRAGAGGTERVEVPDGATVARFDHHSSRSGDPQLHAHLLFMNRVLCDDGAWRTLDGRLLFERAMPASLYGAAVLRVELSQRLGWHWDRVGANLHAEIAGADHSLSTMWSQRSRETAREAQRRIRDFEATSGREPTAEERLEIWNQATVASRASKDLHPLGGDPHQRWRKEAADTGVDPDALVGSYRDAARVYPGTYDRPEVIIDSHLVHVADETVEHLTATAEQIAAGLTDADIDKAVLATITAGGALAGTDAVGGAGVGLVDRLGGALRSELHRRLIHHHDRWYSPGLLAAEVTTAAWLSSPAEDTAAAEARAARLDTDGLGADQTEAARQLVASATTGAVVVGPAGSGKTAMLARAADVAGHHNVVAVAPTAVAAATLGAAIGVRSDTVARLLVAAKDKPTGPNSQPATGSRPDDSNPVPAGGTVIIDEASQLATRDLAAVCGLAAGAGARVILVGDPAQQGSIAAGGMFAALAESGALTTVALAELWRFEDPEEAAVTVKLRAGDRSALDYHRARGRVGFAAHAEIAEAAAQWWQQHSAGSTALSAPTRTLVEEINAEIAARRANAGETGEAVVGEGPATIRVGDIAVTRRNSRRLVASDSQWVKNGDRWVVESVSAASSIRLRRCDTGATVTVPLAYASNHLQLGYAVTQTRAQSVTVQAAYTVATASTRLSELYVGLTRGTRCNHLLVVTDDVGCDEDSPPDQLDPDEVLAGIFSRRAHQSVAADPASGAAARAAAGAHLASVAATGHTAALPVPESFDAAEVLSQADHSELRRRAEDFEQYVEGGIEAWYAQFANDDEQQHDDDELLAALDEWRNIGPQAVPNIASPAHLKGEPPDDTEPDSALATVATAASGGVADPGPPPPQLPPEAYRPMPAATHFVPAGPDADGYDRLGYSGRHIAYDIFNLGTTQQAVNELVDAHPEPYRLAPTDNPALVELVAAHQRSEHAGDVGTAARLAALAAAVADPPLRRQLNEHPDIAAADLDPEDQQWVRSVRSEVLHHRAAAWAPTLDSLSTQRETLHGDIAEVIDSGAFRSAVDSDTLADHDRTLWAARCLLWLDNDATAEGLTHIWRDTNTSLAAVASGEAPPCEATHPRVGDTPWRDLADDSPPPPEPVPLPQSAPRWSFEPPSPPGRPGPDAQLRAAVTSAAEWYHNQLLYSADAAEARHYLESRGIGPDDWTRWQIGWAPNQWRAVANHIANDPCAVAAGIAAESNSGRVFDVMRSRVILPIRDPDGTVVAFAGRTINDNNPDAPKYLNTRTTDLWSKSSTLYGLDQARDTIAATGQASLVEGYLDVIAAHRGGITSTVAACGTAVTDDHIAAIEQAGAHQLHTAFDGDAGGQFATRAALRLARDRGLPTRVVNMPPGTDPDSLTARELHHLWASSEPQPWAAITAQLQADPDPRRSIDASVRATEAVLDETTRQDPLTRLVAAHQTAAAHGHRFTAVLAHDTATQPETRHSGDDNHPEATSVAKALTYGVTDAEDPQFVQDIAETVASLQTAPHAGRQAALSR